MGIAAIVIQSDIIKPGGHFHIAFLRFHIGRIGEIGVGDTRKVAFGLTIGISGPKALIDFFAARAALCLIGIVGNRTIGAGRVSLFACPFRVMAFAKGNHISRVIGDNIEIELHAARVQSINQALEILIAAQMRVNLRIVDCPIAVITSAFIAAIALHRLVFEYRAEPNRGRPQTLNIIEPVNQPGQITPMVKALMRRVIAMG